jgi:hypothetical protein
MEMDEISKTKTSVFASHCKPVCAIMLTVLGIIVIANKLMGKRD